MLWLMIQHLTVVLLAVVIVAAICRFLQPRPATQHLLWLAILLKLCVPPLLMWPWAIKPLLEPPSSTMPTERLESPTSVDTQRSPQISVESAESNMIDLANASTGESPSLAIAPAEVARLVLPPPGTLLGLVWCLSALAVLLLSCLRIHRVQRVLRTASLAPSWLSEEVSELSARLGIAKPRVIVSSHTRTPFVWCLPTPTLVWPERLSEMSLSVERCRGIVIHELAHIRRRDNWVTWAELAAKSIWWWNPIAWYVRWRLRDSADLACDAWVVELQPSLRGEYANALIDICENETAGTVAALALGVQPDSHRTFERRLKMIMSEKRLAGRTVLGWMFVGIVFALAMPGIAWDESKQQPKADGNGLTNERVTEAPDETAAPKPAAARKLRSVKTLRGLFDDVLDRIDQTYVDEVDKKELAAAAIDAMLKGLDEYSALLSREEMENLTYSLDQMVGVGMALMVEEGQIMVKHLVPNSPASQTDIKPGQIIAEINGEPLDRVDESARLGVALRKIRGKSGDPVTLGIRDVDSDEIKPVRIVRAPLNLSPVHRFTRSSFMADEEHKIGYFRIASFTKRTSVDAQVALRDLKKQGVRALIIDLRSCPGGLLTEAVSLSDLFVNTGIIVTVSSRNDGETDYKAHAERTHGDIPIAILADRHTASAAEIFAACLQDHDRATVIGESTFGKGTVQSIFPLKSGAALKLTTAKFLRPNGASLQRADDRGGVQPNEGFEVKLSDDEQQQLAKVLHQRSSIFASDEELINFDDRQLEKALQHLRKQSAG